MEPEDSSSSNPNLDSNNTSSNITSDQIDQETATKLRGDAIGDTMYSEVFVLNTLLQFSDLKWSNEVEDNLCFLWDMTEETDVCKYLFQSSFPSLACNAIQKYEEPRFLEIVVGIFANLMCSKCDEKNNVSEDDIKIVVNLLNCDEPYILIQVMRFVHAVSFMHEKLDFMKEEHLDRFNYVLENSVNRELLGVTLKTLACVTDSMKLSVDIIKGESLKSVITGYKTLKDESEIDFETHEQHTNVRHLIQFVCNLCCYIDSLKNSTLADSIKLNVDDFTAEMVPLLYYHRVDDNLIPVGQTFKYYIEALTYIYKVLNVGYISSLAKPLYDIYFLLSKKEPENVEVVAELLCYFISVGDPESIKKDSEVVKLLKPVLRHIERNAFEFEFDYVQNLKMLLTAL